MIETRRKNGSLVGREVSRQRRWAIRNPEKQKKFKDKYRNSKKGKERRRRTNRIYMRRYRQRVRSESK